MIVMNIYYMLASVMIYSFDITKKYGKNQMKSFKHIIYRDV